MSEAKAALTEAMARIMRKRHSTIDEAERKERNGWRVSASYELERAKALHQAYSIVESLRDSLDAQESPR